LKTKIILFLASACLTLSLNAAQLQAWRTITMPTVDEAAAAFPAPPPEYGAIHWAIWGGQQTKESVLADIERMQANGAHVIMLNCSRGMKPKFFSPEYMDLVKFTVMECKKRGMKVWIEDDAGYPSGFAGGIISRNHPELGMQALVADTRISVAAGQTLTSSLPSDTVGALAFLRQTGETRVLSLPADGQLRWTAPSGNWEIVLVRHVYRSSPTRYTNREDGTNDKDSLYSLIDYLNPEATRVYLKAIHEAYEGLLGEEFGKTVLGFRGDEPDYTGFMPWTPKLLDSFRQMKGYDLQPYLARFFEPSFTQETLRAKADYWDVWSALFRDNFFKPQEDWCKARNMEYMTHLNHEEQMLDLSRNEDLIRNEGSLFRAMRYAGVPGIDNLNQIAPGVVADFPKLAASVAHLNGRPQVWTEQGGALHQAGKFVADYQLVRGINFLQIRGANKPALTESGTLSKPAADIIGYVNRASYLLSIGRPAAQVALFHPTDSLWLGDKEADETTVRLATELLEHQVDFDHADTDALAEGCRLEGGEFVNLSGQRYRAVIIPSSTVIDKRVLTRLQSFAKAGGKVVFVGRTPSMVAGRNFMHPEPGVPDLGFAAIEPSGHINDRVIAALPTPDVKLDAFCAPLKYIHRSLQNAELYFFFNESAQAQTRTATLSGSGCVQVWDATHGTIRPLAGVAKASGVAIVPLTLAPHEARFIVIGSLPSVAGTAMPTASAGEEVLKLDGAWSLTLGDKKLSTPLASWETLGFASFGGTALYEREFDAPSALSQGKRVYLDLGTVQEDARVRLNGVDFEVRSWPPYLWDITAALKPGTNKLEIQVRISSSDDMRESFNMNTPRAPQGARTKASGESQGFAPTGVPGGLGAEFAAGSRDRSGPPPFAGVPPMGGFGRKQLPATPPCSGVLGPVRLLAP
jgi:hypothetical protein